jgi:hypothetical protein
LNAHIFTLLFISLGIVACTPEPTAPDQDKIYISLELTYNVSLDKTTATASFKQENTNGNLLELDNDAAISYEDETLIFDVSSKKYSKELIGLVENSFTYTDLDNDVITNPVSMVDSLQFFTLSDSQSIGNEMLLEIIMDQLNTDEELQIEFVNQTEDYSSSLFSDTYGGSLFQITSDQIENVPVGQVIVKVKRVLKQDHLTESKLAGGDLEVTYEIQDTVIFY